MAKQEIVTIAGQEFTITPLVTRKADLWREKVRVKLAQLNTVGDEDKTKKTEAPTDAQAKLFNNIFDLACAAPSEIRDLLFEYSPEIGKKKEFILDNGYDEEIIDAFIICARMAFPFGKLMSMVKSGFSTPATSTN